MSLRAFYRYFLYKGLEIPSEYYDYVQGSSFISRQQLWEKYPEAAEEADRETLQLTLGDDDGPKGFPFLANKIEKALGENENWLLIGGPPCQAYSLVGRSKQLGEFKKQEASESDAEQRFYKDPRHKLYRQYLRILAFYAPAVFVMENVKGILSAKLNGEFIFPKILADLKTPNVSAKEYGWDTGNAHTYRILSFVTGNEPKKYNEYLIKSEKYGVPQTRHRVILLGIREDIWLTIGQKVQKLSTVKMATTVADVISSLPKLRSGFSKKEDSIESWKSFLEEIANSELFEKLAPEVKSAINESNEQRKSFTAERCSSECYSSDDKLLRGWYCDAKLQHFLNHETRAHMASDLWRYLYVAIMGKIKKRSPQLKDFPDELLPDHKNVLKRKSESETKEKEQKFADRFKVQIWDSPSSTITSHISKDGHYFIHPDPIQCRSLTVREAARLQTFPDNYFFEGNRTQQYHQVGNAVPPYLAYQLSQIVFDIFAQAFPEEFGE